TRLVSEWSSDVCSSDLAPLSFDASTFELWGPLTHGGKLVVCRPGVLSLDELARAIRAHQVTTLWLTAGLFRPLVETHRESFTGEIGRASCRERGKSGGG